MAMQKKRTHIAHVVYSFSTGGLENGMVNLINHLPEDEYFHSIISITHHDAKFVERIKTKNFKVYDLHKPAGSSPKWLVNCWRLLKELRPDICHSRNLNPLEAQIAAFFARVKYRIHGEHGWDINDLGGTNTKYQKLRRVLKPFVSHYIALSSEANQYLQNKIGVASQRISQICNGVNVNAFSPERDLAKPLAAQMPADFASPDTLVFGTVGRLAPVKNQTQLVEAFLQLWSLSEENRKRLRLIIVGDGELMPALQQMVTSHNAQDAVWLAGMRKDVPELMAAMDVFVLPSLAEGISNTILEAMASGLPVIATQVGGSADLLHHEHLATRLVPANNVAALKDGMAIYAQQPALAKQESGMMRQHCVQNFSIEQMVERYHSLYQQAVSR